jgi:hypothetical protein
MKGDNIKVGKENMDWIFLAHIIDSRALLLTGRLAFGFDKMRKITGLTVQPSGFSKRSSSTWSGMNIIYSG